MASSCKYFEEDAVFRINRKGVVEFGLILENSEFVSSDEDEEEERNIPSWERMRRGHVRVAWHPRGHEEVLLEKKVKLFDRSLMPGDVVRRLVKGKDTQLGYCRSTDVRAAIQIVGRKQVITDIKSTELAPLDDFSADIAVFLDSWVGIVKTVKTEVTVRCNDGSRCVLTDDDALDLDDILDRRDKVSEFRKFSFYPSQQLWGPIHCFEKAKWLHTTKEMQSLLTKPGRSVWVTVEQVKVVSMGVQWLCRAYCEGSVIIPDVEQPKYTVPEDDLPRVKMMHIFEPCALQTGDRNYYIMKETDQLVTLEEWKKSVTTRMGPPVFTAPRVQLPDPPQEPKELKTNIGDTPEIHETQHNGVGGNESDFEDMEDDEDNTSDTGSVTSRSTASSIGNKVSKSRAKKGPSLATKFLKKKKLRRARKKIILEALPVKPGERVVTETLVTETKASVMWQDGSTEENISSASLYPIHHIDGHEFFPGDFVMENKDNPKAHEYGVVQKVDHTGRTALVTWLKTYLAGSDPHPIVVSEEEISVYDIKDHPDFRYSPGSCVIRVAHFQDNDPHNTAGQVMDVLPSGKVEVCWVSGKTSHCYPQELYRIGEYDSDDLWADDDSGDDEDSWETESDRSLTGTLDSAEEEDKSPQKLNKPLLSLPVDRSIQTGVSEGPREEGLRNLNLGSEANVALVKEKLLAKIEKLRAGMARMEELFTQNPCLQNTALMRKLLEIYRHCRLLDQLLGTFYFHEKHLQSLVEQLRQRGRINSAQHMADQISRLFSSVSMDSALTGPDSAAQRETFLDSSVMLLYEEDLGDVESNDRLVGKNDTSVDSGDLVAGKSTNDSVSNVDSANVDCGKILGNGDNRPSSKKESACDRECSKSVDISGKVSDVLSQKVRASSASPSVVHRLKDSEPPNACKQLFQLLRVRLLKAHEDLQQIFGMPLSRTSDALQAASNDTSPKHEAKNGDSTVNDSVSDVQTTEAKPDKEQSQARGVMTELSVMTAELNLDDVRSEEAEIECTAGQGVFSMHDTVSDTHKYKLSIFQPVDPRVFFKTVRKELQLLRTSLPEGIIVKGFEDRMDLYSVLIKGSKRTPYEDGLFLFDFQLPMDYPKSPPLCHYISYCSDRLNPNLYEGGRVCVSLLGTWGGKGTEIWNPVTSNLLQVIVSIQGLILVAEPYYNEAGYERQRGTQQGKENSRMYNEMVILKLIQATSMMITSPPDIFKEEIVEHFQKQAPQFVQRLEKWLNISEKWNTSHPMTPVTPTAFRDMHKDAFDFAVDTSLLPEYPLLPASKGFCLTLRKSFTSFKDTLKSAGIMLD